MLLLTPLMLRVDVKSVGGGGGSELSRSFTRRRSAEVLPPLIKETVCSINASVFKG